VGPSRWHAQVDREWLPDCVHKRRHCARPFVNKIVLGIVLEQLCHLLELCFREETIDLVRCLLWVSKPTGINSPEPTSKNDRHNSKVMDSYFRILTYYRRA
jgi:hypothetical protein